MSAPVIKRREAPPRVVWTLEQAGVPTLLARLFAARGVRSAEELDDGLARLLPPATLAGAAEAAKRLADAIEAGQRICIVADYDCDGATACAVAIRGLALLGAARETLAYVVPDRAVHGYGLTPAIVELAAAQAPAVLVTVDNGIASLEGVAHARARGMAVIVTDHHLPAQQDGRVVLPEAEVIVNPNQPGCGFASKNLAGVGVMFYVLLALRGELRERGAFSAEAQPRLDALLDLVALGTVADVVKLDANNRRLVAQGLRRIRAARMQPGLAALFAAAGRDARRASAFDFGFALGPRINAAGRLADMTLGIDCLLTDDPQRAAELAKTLDANNRRLVAQGLKRMRAGRMQPGIAALFTAAGRDASRANAFDLGFALGPRINAAGRLSDMTVGIGCLLCEDPARALELARLLDEINRERREIEAGMRDMAEAQLARLLQSPALAGQPPAALALFDPEFHEGVVGIVASRLKDRVHRPTFVFAQGANGQLKGSGRSIPGFHLRDALDLVSKRHPQLLKKFGGHAMAAGCTLDPDGFADFEAAFRQVASE